MRSLGKAVDGEGAALSHVHLIGVHLKDALLGKLVFQFDGDQHFQQLALDRLFRGEEEAARELHGHSGAALSVTAFAYVDDRRLQQAKIIDPAMLEEAAVLDGEHRVHQHFRNLVELDELALGAVLAFKQSRHQLRFQLVGLEAPAVFSGLVNGGDFATFEPDHGAFFSVEGFGAGNYLNTMRGEGIMADRRIIASGLPGVSCAAQLGGNLCRVKLLPYGDGLRASVDPGRVAEDRSSHAAVHNRPVLCVKEGEHHQKEEAGDEKAREEQLNQRIGDREVLHTGWPASPAAGIPPGRGTCRSPAIR